MQAGQKVLHTRSNEIVTIIEIQTNDREFTTCHPLGENKTYAIGEYESIVVEFANPDGSKERHISGQEELVQQA